MTYFAAVLTRAGNGWQGREVDLDGLADGDDVVDLLRDLGRPGAPTLLVVEREDEWFALARLVDDELKIFVSDVYGVAHSGLGDALLPVSDEVLDEDPGDDDSDDGGDGASVLIAVPGGDADLLTDLGIPDDDLVAVCAEEGALPADVLSEIAERLGSADAYDALR